MTTGWVAMASILYKENYKMPHPIFAAILLL
jgi:hypothetical protein